jgi:hypothetical protein
MTGLAVANAAAVLVLLLLNSAMASAAGDDSYCPIALDDAVTLEREQIEHLFNMRGIPRDVAEAVAYDLEESVERYLTAGQNDGRSRGLLFYIGNTEVLCAIFWKVGSSRPDRAFHIERLELAPDDMVAAIDDLMLQMQRSESGTSRVIVPRDTAPPLSSRGAAPLRGTGDEDAGDPLDRLSEILFPGEIRNAIAGLASLTVLPCLNIATVPFSALDPDGDGAPLVLTTTVNVEAELDHIRQSRLLVWRTEIGNAAIFGNPAAWDDPDWEYPDLPGAELEAKRIAARLGSTAVTGAAVTRDRIRSVLAQSDYIHIAAHGLSSASEPLDGSFLAVSDGRLVALEIQGFELAASPLVVLSACQSGLGGRLDAGIVGLARAFIVGGAMEVVATLWNVDDAATETIMVDFVENLGSMTPPEALRKAQAAARERWPDPRIWSGFLVFGSRAILE